MIEVQAPNNEVLKPLFSSNIPARLFLAGGISGCADWQRQLLTEMGHVPNVIAFNPRRENFDINDPSVSVEQIKWEKSKLDGAHIIAFWFAPETLNPITLYELGVRVGSRKNIVVGVHPKYARAFDVQTQLDLEGIEVHVGWERFKHALSEKFIAWNDYWN